ncbi:MAG: sulfate adenylyltransferase [Thaumarchaeota archaeon]|nr:sulfate adenylyltransferase [Nitrososphaerota archaeon]
MPPPHGGKLVDRILKGNEREKALSEFADLQKIVIDDETLTDCFNIGNGIFSPLQGFLDRDAYLKVINEMHLPDGSPWTIPILLDVSKEDLGGAKEGDRLGLSWNGNPVAVLDVQDVYTFDKAELAKKVYSTNDTAHPGVVKTQSMKDNLVGGKISILNAEARKQEHSFTPAETRNTFQERGWKTVVGFQTRNVPHSGHEGLQKAALNLYDGLFINPVIGKKKKGDFKDEVILGAYSALIENYYPKQRVFFGILNWEMRYAGPKEAIMHAIMRKNFGCTHFIIGRDHAGVGNFYHPFAAQEIFKEFPDLIIEPLMFPAFFYCKKCFSVANEKTCPHGRDDLLEFSGTLMRNLINNGTMPPKELIRPEVAAVIAKWKDPFVS